MTSLDQRLDSIQAAERARLALVDIDKALVALVDDIAVNDGVPWRIENALATITPIYQRATKHLAELRALARGKVAA